MRGAADESCRGRVRCRGYWEFVGGQEGGGGLLEEWGVLVRQLGVWHGLCRDLGTGEWVAPIGRGLRIVHSLLDN